MDDSIPVFVMGGSLIALGLYLIWRHELTWRKQCSTEGLSQGDMGYFRQQHRRRVQTSGLLTIIGVLMLVGGWMMNAEVNPYWLLLWLIGLLLLVAWVVMLALGDWMAIRAHTQAALTEVRTRQLVLEREADRLRAEVSSNDAGNGQSHSR